MTGIEILTKIWVSPKETLKYVHEKNYNRHVTILLTLTGITSTFNQIIRNGIESEQSLTQTIIWYLFLGVIFGWISFYIYASGVSWVGRYWLKGEGDSESILKIMCYAMLPSIVALLFLIPQLAVYGMEIFRKDGDTQSAGWVANAVVYFFEFLRVVFAIWTAFLIVIGVAEVHKISIFKAMLSLFLPAFILALVLFVIQSLR